MPRLKIIGVIRINEVRPSYYGIASIRCHYLYTRLSNTLVLALRYPDSLTGGSCPFHEQAAIILRGYLRAENPRLIQPLRIA